MDESARHLLRDLWTEHQAAPVPAEDNGDAFAELMHNNTFVAGVVSTMVDVGQVLTPHHREVLKVCVASLDELVDDLGVESAAYAKRLSRMADLLLRDRP